MILMLNGKTGKFLNFGIVRFLGRWIQRIWDAIQGTTGLYNERNECDVHGEAHRVDPRLVIADEDV